MNLSRYRLAHPDVGRVHIKPVQVRHFHTCLFFKFFSMFLLRINMNLSRYRLAHPRVGTVYISPFQQYVLL